MEPNFESGQWHRGHCRGVGRGGRGAPSQGAARQQGLPFTTLDPQAFANWQYPMQQGNFINVQHHVAGAVATPMLLDQRGMAMSRPMSSGIVQPVYPQQPQAIARAPMFQQQFPVRQAAPGNPHATAFHGAPPALGSAPPMGRPASAAAPPASAAAATLPVSLQHQSDMRFKDLPISPMTKRAMAEVFGYEFCTHVQAQALPACFKGGDVLAKAKTGTGKTIGFMIPVIETLLRRRKSPGQVGALVLSPTRELATQIYQEVVKLLTFHHLTVQVIIGGTNIRTDVSKLQRCVPDVLVATPGRCLDHLTNPESSLADNVRELQVLVCDEADNILDMGFRPTIERILSKLPPKGQRQALLFSATFPSDVQDLARFALQAPWSEVDTVGGETQTNTQVDQYQQVVRFEDQLTYVYAALQAHIQDNPQDYKVIAFFTTARQTQLFAEAFQATGMDVLEIHSRKSQAHRTRVSEQFRRAPCAIMFSSDVSARGVDYPDVSLVMQIGVPSDKAQYVHRVGRTARAGKAGEALLVLCEFEKAFLRQLSDLPVAAAPNVPITPEVVRRVQQGLARVSEDTKGKAYAAWLGFYNSNPTVKLPAADLVALANHFSTVIGCAEQPELEAKTVGKMGLKGVPGLRIAGRGPAAGGGGGGGGGGGRGGGGRGGGRGNAGGGQPAFPAGPPPNGGGGYYQAGPGNSAGGSYAMRGETLAAGPIGGRGGGGGGGGSGIRGGGRGGGGGRRGGRG